MKQNCHLVERLISLVNLGLRLTKSSLHIYLSGKTHVGCTLKGGSTNLVVENGLLRLGALSLWKFLVHIVHKRLSRPELSFEK